MRRLGRERGSALVELAMGLPLLLVVLFFAMDFGRAYYVAMVLTDAARAGAQYGAGSPSKSTDTGGMTTAATNAAVNVSGISVSPQRVCACATNSGGTITNQSCTATCSGGHVITFAQVDVSKVFTPVTRFPGIPTSVTIQRRATMRVAPN